MEAVDDGGYTCRSGVACGFAEGEEGGDVVIVWRRLGGTSGGTEDGDLDRGGGAIGD